MSADTVLWRSGCLVLGLALVCLMLTFLDSRQVTGVNAWIKPLKFSLSVGVYFLTLALLLPLAEITEGRRQLLSWGISLLLGVTYLMILVQAARGVRSHFNNSTALDAAIFGGMGITITLQTILLGVFLWSFHQSTLPSAFLWGIRLGLLCAILGSLQGFAMTSRLAHTVGAPDGGRGLPFVNWSTVAGDLRIAHAIALHGLQILPLAGWWISRQQVPRGSLLVALLFLAQMGLATVTFLQALSGKPLFADNTKAHP